MSARMPVVFIPHGGGPWPFVETGFPKHELEALAGYLRGVHDLPPEPPRRCSSSRHIGRKRCPA